MLSTIRNYIKQMTIKKYADRKESIEMFSKAMQSLDYTANSTTDFFCGFRTRSRNTPIGRRALKCSARPCSLCIIQLKRQQTFRASISGQDPEIRRQEGEH